MNARVVALVLALLVCSATAQERTQIKIESPAAGISPSDAFTFYGGPSTPATSTREFWGPDPNVNRPVELKELARALRNDVDLIYEYVHDNIRTTFMYGLQKGALGAMLDQSGTPFDQAHLMVELLRESGYSARFKAGTLLLNASQVNAWLGVNNSTAAQKIFRDGGIPLDFLAGPTYTISHVWVEVTIPGSACNTTCWFDPSYKSHTFTSALNLETLMGWGANEFSTTDANSFLVKSWTGITQQSATSPAWVSGIHDTNLQTKLQGYATTLLTNLRSTHSTKEISEVIGGQEIVKTGATPVRNNAVLPGFATLVQHTWDCPSSAACGVPDQYRTKLTVGMFPRENPPYTGPPLVSKQFFVDEIYGRRLYFDTPSALSLPDQLSGLESFVPFCIKLTLDGVPVPGASTPCDTIYPEPPFRDHDVRLEVDHPYAATGGLYADMDYDHGTHMQQRADFALPVVILHGYGDVSPALLSKLASEQERDRLVPFHNPPGTVEPQEFPRTGSSMDHTMTKLAAAYLVQYSRMAEIQKRIGNAEHVQHHTIGIVFSATDVTCRWPVGQCEGQPLHWFINDRAIRMTVSGSVSIASKADVAADRTKVIHSTMAAAALLEGSLYEQMLDAVETSSTATRFQWGNNTLGANHKFYIWMPTSTGTITRTDLGCQPSHTGSTPTGYSTAGFWEIGSTERCLGPGNMYGSKTGGGAWGPTKQRGGAAFFFMPDASSVAHVVTTGIEGHKGGGAGISATYANEFDPTGAASLLKDSFEDRSRLHGVDLQSGEFSYSPAADLSIGEGGFPYALTMQRSFRPSSSSSPGLAPGWGHNFDIRASIAGDGLAAMGQDSPLNAAATIAALYTAQKIFSVSPAPAGSPTLTQLRDHLKRWVLAPFVMNWWGKGLSGNVVTINAGNDARQFTRLADGAFNPPRNGVGTLVQTGVRTPKQKETWPAGEWEGWEYEAISFRYTSPEKDYQDFAYFEAGWDSQSPIGGIAPVNTESNIGEQHGWHITNWTFPYGASLTFNYATGDQWNEREIDRLASISNNLGRTLTFNYVDNYPQGYGSGFNLQSVSDGTGRSVTYTHGAPAWSGVLQSVTSPENVNGAEISKYSYVGDGQNPAAIPAGARPQLQPKLWRVFAPTDATNPKVQVDYDRTWRAKEYRDAVAILTPAQRGPWSFHVTGTSRGERVDPLGGRYKDYYDARGRAFQLIDEENRVVNQLFDNHDRVKERTFPEGNQARFEYDETTHNINKLTQLRKSGTYWTGTETIPDIVATYDSNCRKIKSITDAKGKVTTWNYHVTNCTLTSVVQPPVANPEAGGALAPPTTNFLYDPFGQVTRITDPTNRVVDIEYDATTKYRLRRRVNQAGLNLTTTYGHNAWGDISSVTDPRGNQTTYIFDKVRRLTRLDGPAGTGVATINRIDLDGDVYQVERSTNLAKTTWQIWQKSFTPTKKTATETSPTSAITQYAYDALDRVSVVTDPDGRKVLTDYFMDGKTNRVVKAHQSGKMSPLEYVSYTYSPNGQIDTVEDANSNFTNLDYDAFDRLHRTFHADPASGTPCTPGIPHSASAPSCGANQKYEQLGYDANGNVTSKRNRSGQSLAFVFDALNRETTRNVPVNTLGHFARTLTTGYDLASRKWDVTADGQTLSHRYDAAGRVDYVDDSLLGGTNRLDHAYDAADNRTSVTYPGGTTVSYAYDALNRMDTVTEGGTVLADYDWDPLSRRDLVKLNANAFNMDLAYEADDDLLTLTHTGPAPLTFTFGRNQSGQITSLGASDGAFLSRPVSTVATPYVPNRLNQYASVGGTAYSHDANGNLTGDGTYTFEYDEENRLRSAVGGGNTTTYEYDPLGRRRSKTVNGTQTRFVSDNAEEIEERNSGNTVLRRYVYGSGIDERIAMLDAACTGGRCYYLTNWQGSTTTLVNQTGSTLNATYHYGPYGEGTNWSPADALTGNPFRYTGRRVDPETGLYYYRARYYSPRLGRFMQTDPIGATDDRNLYVYVTNDSLNNVDPSGKCRISSECHEDAMEPHEQIQESPNDDGSVTTSRERVTYPSKTAVSVQPAGSIRRMPQDSAEGEPASVSISMQSSLLNFSEMEDAQINVHSGQRTEEQNTAVGGAKSSQHLIGNGDAADISISQRSGSDTAARAFHSGEFKVTNLYKDGRVHVDQRNSVKQPQYREEWEVKQPPAKP